MKRRDFVTGLTAGVATVGITGCTKAESNQSPSTKSNKTYNWKMVTAWPPNFPGLGTGALDLAQNIAAMTNGQIKVKVYGAGEIVPALESFDAVSRGTAEIGHAAAYYWKGKNPASQFFGAVPFGMNSQEMNAWLYFGGGLDLWKEIYAPFNLIPAPVGNTGVQMGGWFNKEINSIDDLKGLKMRIPGLGGEVLQRAGGTPVNVPGGEIFNALQLGQIDACEWVGPYNDRAFGLHKAAKYYYYPGWHEPCATLEAFFNKDAFAELPEHLQTTVLQACQASNMNMLSEYAARNASALKQLVEEDGVTLKAFPDEVLNFLRTKSEEVISELAKSNKDVARVYSSYKTFQEQIGQWHDISEAKYYGMR